MLIGISGKARSGKDTMGDILAFEFGYTKVSFADAIKQDLRDFGMLTLEDLHGEKKEQTIEKYGKSPRVIMQEYGAKMREIYPAFWIDRLFQYVDNEIPHLVNKCITDVRLPNEVNAVQVRGGVVVRVIRDDELRGVVDNPLDKTEMILDEFEPNDPNLRTLIHPLVSFDAFIENNGTMEEFEEKVSRFMKGLK